MVTAIEDGVIIALTNDCEHVNNTGCECHGGSEIISPFGMKTAMW
ncbi:MAG: hypothetical protein ACLVKR_02975 [Lachnospiraceae bacterium]